MSIQSIWKRLMINRVPLSFHGLSMRHPLAFYAKPRKNFANFCTEIAVPATTPARGVVTEFLLSKCGLTDADITKAYRHTGHLLRAKSSQNMEEVLELLNGCGLTTPAQIRRVVLGHPGLFWYRAERNIKSKLSFLRTFMKEEDITKLVQTYARFLGQSERRIKSAISLLHKLGIDGEALSEILATQPRLLTTQEEKVMESFKQAEDLGYKKGSKMFARALRQILGLRQESLDRRRQCLRSLGFSENQISDIWRKKPTSLGVTEEKMKRNVDFVVKTAGIPLVDLVKYPNLFEYSVETRMIPRYRVMEALKSMQVQVQAPTKKGKKEGLSFLRIVIMPENRFLEKYVNSNAESSALLLDIYHGRREIWKADH
jgi:mTERF domain-containing protein